MKSSFVKGVLFLSIASFPQLFFSKYNGDFGIRIESYLEGFMWSGICKIFVGGEISEKLPGKNSLGN